MEQITINGHGRGVIEPDYNRYNVGDWYEVNGEKYLIVHKESLRKYTDGKYEKSPCVLILRVFSRSPNV